MYIKPEWGKADTLEGIALEWVVAMNATMLMPPETCARFQAWLNADPAHGIAYRRSAEKYEEIMDLCRHLAPLYGEPVPEKKQPS